LAKVVDAGVLLDVVRALTKLGIAIAAKRPIMATTIMISQRETPFTGRVDVHTAFLSFAA